MKIVNQGTMSEVLVSVEEEAKDKDTETGMRGKHRGVIEGPQGCSAVKTGECGGNIVRLWAGCNFPQSLGGQGKLVRVPVFCQIPLMPAASAYIPRWLPLCSCPGFPQVGWLQLCVSFTVSLYKLEAIVNKAEGHIVGSQVLVCYFWVVFFPLKTESNSLPAPASFSLPQWICVTVYTASLQKYSGSWLCCSRTFCYSEKEHFVIEIVIRKKFE